MRTAIITGASSGLGMEFARQVLREFPETECVWLIARRKDRLEEAAKPLAAVQTELMPLDLCDPASFAFLEEKLRLRPLPIIGRITHEQYTLDVRTLMERDFPYIAQTAGEVLMA